MENFVKMKRHILLFETGGWSLIAWLIGIRTHISYYFCGEKMSYLSINLVLKNFHKKQRSSKFHFLINVEVRPRNLFQ